MRIQVRDDNRLQKWLLVAPCLTGVHFETRTLRSLPTGRSEARIALITARVLRERRRCTRQARLFLHPADLRPTPAPRVLCQPLVGLLTQRRMTADRRLIHCHCVLRRHTLMRRVVTIMHRTLDVIRIGFPLHGLAQPTTIRCLSLWTRQQEPIMLRGN